MTQTSITLLNRLQQTGDSETWNRLVALYAPLLYSWLRRYDVQECDRDNLVQEVLMAISKDLPSFDHNGRPGAFRAWLRSMLVNQLRNFWRTRRRHIQVIGGSDMVQRLALLDDPASQMSQLWNQQHDRHVVRQLMTEVEPHFTADTWTAFTRVAIEGQPADAVAAELGISTNAVFIAKSRVLSRLRTEATGLVDANSSFPAKS